MYGLLTMAKVAGPPEYMCTSKTQQSTKLANGKITNYSYYTSGALSDPVLFDTIILILSLLILLKQFDATIYFLIFIPYLFMNSKETVWP